jgi:hypothetical protein
MTREIIKFVIKDRVALVLALALIVTTLITCILLFFWVRPSDIQIPIRYSGYDNSLYNDRWYERLSFVVFLIFHTVSTTMLAFVMHARGYRVMAYFLLGLGIFMAISIAVVASAVTRTVTL